jgi:hypothetical protein
MAKFEYSIRSKDETSAGVKSAKAGLENLEGSVRGISHTLKTLMGGGAIAGVTMALRRMAQIAGEAEKAFAEMHPETQKAAGSLTDWNTAMKGMQSSAGGIVADILTPIRAALLDIIDPAHRAKAALEGIWSGEGWEAKYTSSATKLADQLAESNKALKDAQASSSKLSTSVSEYSRMRELLLKSGRPDIMTVAKRYGYTEPSGMTNASVEDLEVSEANTRAISRATDEVKKWEDSLRRVNELLSIAKSDLADANEAIAEIPNWQAELIKKDKPGKPKEPEGWLYGSAAGYLPEAMTTAMRGALRAELPIILADTQEAAEAIARAAEAAAISTEESNAALQEMYAEQRAMRRRAEPEYGLQTFLGQMLTGIRELAASGTTGRMIGSFGAAKESGESGIAAVLGVFASALGGLISQFTSLQLLLDPVNTILQAMFDTLEPVINSLLAPLVGILTIIGNTLGQVLTPLLQVLAPVIQLVTDVFVWLYNNAIVPVANGFIYLFTFLGALAKLIYYIVTFQWGKIKGITWSADEDSLLKPISASDVATAGTETIAATESDATSTYSTGRDITVNVVINTDVITGEGGVRELALLINREITNAIALGVA